MDVLDEYLEAQRESMIRDLRALIGIRSIKGPSLPGAPFGREIRAALDFVLDRGKALGFAVKDVDGYGGHVEWGAGSELVGVLAHLDVVPAEDGWRHPPFGGEIDAGRLYGRGASDDKGPVIACLYALAALRASGWTPRRRLRLILGCDEESGWECVERYFAVEERPLYGFSPDADFPPIMAEKGLLSLELRRRWSDPGGGPVRIGILQGGTRSNIVPERCLADLAVPADRRAEAAAGLRAAGHPIRLTQDGEAIHIETEGVAAHASLPEQGLNAIGRMCLSLRKIADWLPQEQREALKFLSDGIGLTYDGSMLGIACRDAVSGPLTLNLGTVAWDEQGARIRLDIRYPVTADKQSILDRISREASHAGFAMQIIVDLPPLYVPEDHPLVEKLKRVFAAKTGNDAAPIAIGGRTYACAIGTGIAFGPIFPGRPNVAHQRDEYIDLDELMLCAKIYAAAMAELCGCRPG